MIKQALSEEQTANFFKTVVEIFGDGKQRVRSAAYEYTCLICKTGIVIESCLMQLGTHCNPSYRHFFLFHRPPIWNLLCAASAQSLCHV
jgi:hypothetical protein